MPAPIVNLQQVFSRVALRTGLIGDTFHRKRSLAPLISEVCGLRGDRLEPAHLALAARIPTYKPQSLLRELQDKRTLVRTWSIKGQLNIVPTRELGEYLAAAGASARWKRYLESRSVLSPNARLRLLKRLCKTSITNDALKTAFPEASMRQVVLREAAHRGHIIWTEGEGTSAAFGWTKDLLEKPIEPDLDFRDVVARYLDTYAPVAVADLANWLGVTVAAARQLMAKHRVQDVEIDGFEGSFFIPPKTLEALHSTRKRAAKGLIVVPPGDPLVTAYKLRWREEGEDTPGIAFFDAEPVGKWFLERGEVKLTMIDGSHQTAVEKRIQGILDLAQFEAKAKHA